MLSYAAILPGSPIFLEGLGKETDQIAKQQKEHMADIIDEVYARNIESIIILLPGKEDQNNFELISNKDLSFDLSDFGELKYNYKMFPDLFLIDQIQRYFRKEGVSTMLETHEHLPFQAAPTLTKLLKEHKLGIVAITVPRIEHKKLFSAGKILKEIVHHSQKRIAVIAAGDGFNNNEENEHLSNLVKSLNAGGLINQSSSPDQDILEQILVLFGVLDMHAVSLEHFSYQSPLGIGFITAGLEV